MKATPLSILGLASLAGLANAATIKVDNNGQGPAPDSTWNTLATPPASATTVLDTGGNDIGVTVVYSGFNDSSSSGKEGAFDGTAWDNAADDYFFVDDTVNTSGTVTISGLTVGGFYDLELIGSDTSTDRQGDYTVNGSFGGGSAPFNGDFYDPVDDGNVLARVMTFSNVEATGGVITISLTPSGNRYGILSAYTISDAIPEPSGATLAMFALSLGLLRRRR